MTLSLANRARLETVDRALSAELLGVAGGRVNFTLLQRKGPSSRA